MIVLEKNAHLKDSVVAANSNPAADSVHESPAVKDSVPVGPKTELRSVSDGSLLRRFRLGKEEAATELYRRYATRLALLAKRRISRKLGTRLDEQDVVQSVFRRLFTPNPNGDYDLPTGDDLWDYLAVVTLNRLKTEETHHRAAKRDLRRTTGDDQELQALRAIADNQMTANAVLRITIEDALQQLPPSYGEVLQLRMAGYEVAEIAERIKRSKRSVERILQAMRNHFCHVLERRSEDRG